MRCLPPVRQRSQLLTRPRHHRHHREDRQCQRTRQSEIIKAHRDDHQQWNSQGLAESGHSLREEVLDELQIRAEKSRDVPTRASPERIDGDHPEVLQKCQAHVRHGSVRSQPRQSCRGPSCSQLDKQRRGASKGGTQRGAVINLFAVNDAGNQPHCGAKCNAKGERLHEAHEYSA